MTGERLAKGDAGRVAVFGGAGFLGLYVVEELIAQGFDALVCDKHSPPASVGARFRELDICDLEAVRDATRGVKYVFNFAAVSDIDEAAENPLPVTAVNVLGNVHVLQACVEAGVQKFVFASSVYVNSDCGLFYRSSKFASERFIEDYGSKFGLKYAILRYGSVYGPRAGADNAISDYVRQALQDGRIVRAGDGEEIREYIHVRDAAIGAVRSLNPEFDDAHLVISGIGAMPVRELLEMIREILRGEVEIAYGGQSPLTHYRITPYTHSPRIARKLILETYYDLGQGLLDLITSIESEMADEQNVDAR